jgi:hypothetical protein
MTTKECPVSAVAERGHDNIVAATSTQTRTQRLDCIHPIWGLRDRLEPPPLPWLTSFIGRAAPCMHASLAAGSRSPWRNCPPPIHGVFEIRLRLRFMMALIVFLLSPSSRPIRR